MTPSKDTKTDEILKTTAPMTAQRSDAEVQKLLRAEISQLRAENARLERQIGTQGDENGSPALEALERRHQVELALAHQAHIVWYQGHGESLPPLPEMIDRLNNSPLFNAQWYAARDPAVQEAGLSPAEHYARVGAYEGRDPGPDFDTMEYYQANPDVAASRWPALLHYEMFGRAEGRQLQPED